MITNRVMTTNPSSLLFLMMIISLFIFWSSSPSIGVDAKELVLTKEWQRVGENDTVPAGAHIRMDMTTGEKLAKLVDPAEDPADSATLTNDELEIDSSGNVVARETSSTGKQGAASSRVSTAAAVVAPTDEKSTSSSRTNKNAADAEPHSPQYDYDLMHRTLSNLPKEEQERMGGLPELPSPDAKATHSDEVRKIFEERMKELWEQRQEELAKIQEELLVDLPQLLKDRIQSIEEYLQDPQSHHVRILANADLQDGEGGIRDVLGVLEDLEYQLTDVDMTRDFHTLGGWPLLVSLITDDVHTGHGGQNITEEVDASSAVIHDIQATAAWAMGTAVKNTAEFNPYVTEPIPLDQRTKTTALDVLVEQLIRNSGRMFEETDLAGIKKQQKILYALGSMLRSNRLAQRYFVAELDGPAVLAKELESYCNLHDDTTQKQRYNVKLIKKIFNLVDDIVSDVNLHGGEASDDATIVEAFSDDRVCRSILSCFLQQKVDDGSRSSSSTIIETALHTLQTLGSHCTRPSSVDLFVNPALRAIQQVLGDPDTDLHTLDLATSTRKEILDAQKSE